MMVLIKYYNLAKWAGAKFRRRGLNSINYLKFKFKIDGNNNNFEFYR